MTQNYLAAEDAIVARLQAQIPGLEVKAVGDYDERAFKATKGLSAVVIYAGDEPKSANRDALLLPQKWLVVLLVKGPKPDRAAAGEMLSRITFALHGWAPGAEHDEMHRGACTTDGYDGHLEYALEFTCDLTLRRG